MKITRQVRIRSLRESGWEIGYFYSIRKESQPIFEIRTDFRSAGDVSDAQVNLMIDWSCDLILSSTEELLNKPKDRL